MPTWASPFANTGRGSRRRPRLRWIGLTDRVPVPPVTTTASGSASVAADYCSSCFTWSSNSLAGIGVRPTRAIGGKSNGISGGGLACRGRRDPWRRWVRREPVTQPVTRQRCLHGHPDAGPARGHCVGSSAGTGMGRLQPQVTFVDTSFSRPTAPHERRRRGGGLRLPNESRAQGVQCRRLPELRRDGNARHLLSACRRQRLRPPLRHDARGSGDHDGGKAAIEPGCLTRCSVGPGSRMDQGQMTWAA
jgi:hypothetical protein